MNDPAIPADPSPGRRGSEAQTTSELVFSALLTDIVRGAYPPGARLPAERELARVLGASRPTLREALRRLTAWQLIEPRRGSGIVVRDRRSWSIEVLPAYLRYGGGQPGQEPPAAVLADLLALRRSMTCEILRIVAERMPPGGTEAPRRAAERAWSLREDGPAFARADFEVIHDVAQAAGFLPAVWLLNRLGSVYFDIADSIAGAIVAPDDYLLTLERLFTALEAHDADRAIDVIRGYLERHDARILTALEALS